MQGKRPVGRGLIELPTDDICVTAKEKLAESMETASVCKSLGRTLRCYPAIALNGHVNEVIEQKIDFRIECFLVVAFRKELIESVLHR